MQLHPSKDPLDDVALPLVRALVVGHDPLVRESVARRVMGSASEAHSDDAADAVARSRAEVVLWDLGPGATDPADAGFDKVDVPVVALVPGDADALRWVAAGAAAVLRRDVDADALRSALQAVREGLRVIEPSLLNLPAAPSKGSRDAADLTPRELEVLELMAVGLSNKQIAAKLGISSHTAKFHIGAILSKLDSATRTEAVVRGVQRGIIVV